MNTTEAEEARKFLNKNLHFVIQPPSRPNQKHNVCLEVYPNVENREEIQTDLIHGGTQWALTMRFKNLTREEIRDIASQWFKTNLYKTLEESGLSNKDFARVSVG